MAHPHLQGLGFDLPEVAPIFEEYVNGLGLADRLSFVPGDFFQQDLPTKQMLIETPGGLTTLMPIAAPACGRLVFPAPGCSRWRDRIRC